MTEHTEHVADTDGSIDDVYPLTPMQEGILFHVLYAPGSQGYLSQYVFS
ncbi:MAG: hypothetical protein JO040_12315, partial [Gemmatimonadetes bacterium]|nr:hypothetical protein [Gemmatimonadota bacterium]